jgi:ABC-type polysaccharide/polyol phosphate export permease
VILNLSQAFIFTFSGALYPLIILPELLRLLPLSLPTYYIAEALRVLISSESQSLALGGVPRLLIVTLAYGSIGSILYRRFSRSIRGGVAA